jgi:N utilization substance protein B
MGVRRKGRELALQALYQLEMTGERTEAALASLWQSAEGSAQVKEFAATLVRGVLEHRAKIDELISEVAENWRLERLSRIDLNAIRIAVFELTNEPPLPVEVAINEAIEIARRFGTEESASFVNGILDQVAIRLGRKKQGEVTGDEPSR